MPVLVVDVTYMVKSKIVIAILVGHPGQSHRLSIIPKNPTSIRIIGIKALFNKSLSLIMR